MLKDLPGDLAASSLLDWMGVQPNVAGLNAVSPDVLGVSSFEFQQSCISNFTNDSFTLAGGCPAIHHYDAIGALGAAVVTHRYATSGTPGAVVMNKDDALFYDSVMMGFNWNDIVSRQGASPSPPSPTALMAARILQCVLPLGCVRNYTPITDSDPIVDAVPGKPALHANVPNPFNPTTTLPFDVAQSGRVQLVVFDVSGRRVRTLVDAEYPVGRHQHRWDGLDDAGDRPPH